MLTGQTIKLKKKVIKCISNSYYVVWKEDDVNYYGMRITTKLDFDKRFLENVMPIPRTQAEDNGHLEVRVRYIPKFKK